MDKPAIVWPLSTDAASFIAKVKPLLINGEWLSGSYPISVEDPSTGQALLTLGQATDADVDAAVAAARSAFEHRAWAQMRAVDRALLLFRFADFVERDAGVIAELESVDSGIPISMSNRIALPLAIDLLRYYAGLVTKLGGEPLSATSEVVQGAHTLTYTQRQPIGVVAQIIPWNVPLVMAVLKIAPALTAGCTVVLKPAELTPLTALYLGQLAVQAGFPPGVINIVNGRGASVDARLASHPGVDKVAFTGTAAVGRSIVAAATGNLKKVSLELGGQSPIIVFDDADLDLAIPGAAMAAFLFQGQNCMAGARLFVHRKVHDRVVAGIEGLAKSFTIGPSMGPATVIGPLISRKHLDRVKCYIELGQQEGAELVTGGRSPQLRGYFIEPTMFTNTTPSMRIVREGIFGPVLCVQRFDDDDLEALGHRFNDSIYARSASVWTTNCSRAHRMARIIRAAQVSINCHGATGVNLPFDGYKQSGWDREYRDAALELYTETKATTIRLSEVVSC
jgi:phenylacetaldehyde dehydrogenase